MNHSLTDAGNGFYFDDKGNQFFLVSEFLHQNGLPSDPFLALVVICDLWEVDPHIEVLDWAAVVAAADER